MGFDKSLTGRRPGERGVNRGFMVAVAAVMLLYLIIAIYRVVDEQIIAADFNNFLYTEFLINFEGGFVRRGLLGEMLYKICLATGADPTALIQTICIASYLFVAIYFVVKFRQKGVTLLLIATPFMCGYFHDFIRKDYLQIALLIVIYLLLRSPNPPAWRIIAAILIGVLGIFLHEAFIFWGIPVTVLALLSHKGTRGWGIAAGIVSIGCFCLLAYFKGNSDISCRIIDSWNTALGKPVIRDGGHSIEALSWELAATAKMHLLNNFYYDRLGKFGWTGIVARPLGMLLIYYFLSNVIFTLKGNNSDAPGSDKTTFSALLLFSIVCLLPMFTILSCDYGRIYQYIMMSATAAYVTFTPRRFRTLMPAKVLAVTAQFNVWLSHICKPGPYLMLVLMLVVAPAPVCYTPTGALASSPLGTIISINTRQLSML